MDTRPNDETITYIGQGVHGNKKTQAPINLPNRKFRDADNSTTGGVVERVPLNLSKAIAQGRQKKGWTQKHLATAIGEKSAKITEYENGKAIPNNNFIVKMEKALGLKLPRPPKKKRQQDE